jgi:type IV pilus assembly protein PilM
MEVPKASQAEMEQAVEFHLKENVPLGADEAVFDYSILEDHQNKYLVNVSVYPAAIANEYAVIMERAGFTLLSLEIEGQATARALLRQEHTEPTLIVDVGRDQASMSISVGGAVTFTTRLETGGDQFTRAIARSFDVSFQEAEKLKRDHGYRDIKESANVYSALRPVVEGFKETIKKHFMYWQMHTSSSKTQQGAVSRVILVGGNANIEGLPQYLEAALEVPVEVGNVWANIFSFNEYIPTMHRDMSLEFATAAGLALRSLIRSS